MDTEDLLARCRSAVINHGGHPNGAWSTGEQLAVAVVLNDAEHLDAMGYTFLEALARVRSGTPLSNDILDWLGWIQDEIRREVPYAR